MSQKRLKQPQITLFLCCRCVKAVDSARLHVSPVAYIVPMAHIVMYITCRTPRMLQIASINGNNNAVSTPKVKDKDVKAAVANDAAVCAHNDLLARIGQGQCKDAFSELFAYYAPRIKSFYMKSGMDAATADELAQETMINVWQKSGSFDPAKAKASTWIFTIARNKRIDFFRKEGRPLPDLTDPSMLGHIDERQWRPDVASEEEAASDALSDAMKDLPEEQMQMIKKAYFEDKSQRDIAEETGLPLGTVKSRMRLALEKLRYSLKGQEL